MERLLESYENANYKPKFDGSDNAFIVTLPNINYLEKKNANLLKESSKEECYIKNNGKITRAIAENFLELEKSEQTTC